MGSGNPDSVDYHSRTSIIGIGNGKKAEYWSTETLNIVIENSGLWNSWKQIIRC